MRDWCHNSLGLASPSVVFAPRVVAAPPPRLSIVSHRKFDRRGARAMGHEARPPARFSSLSKALGFLQKTTQKHPQFAGRKRFFLGQDPGQIIVGDPAIFNGVSAALSRVVLLDGEVF